MLTNYEKADTNVNDPRKPNTKLPLPKKHPLARYQQSQKTGVVSPTDKMMSPCTNKILLQKQKGKQLASIKPKSLTEAFADAEKEEMEEKLDTGKKEKGEAVEMVDQQEKVQ